MARNAMKQYRSLFIQATAMPFWSMFFAFASNLIFTNALALPEHLLPFNRSSAHVKSAERVWLDLKAEKMDTSHLKIELVTHNDNDESIYVMGSPTTVRGSSSPYLNLHVTDGSAILEVSVKLFPPPFDNYPVNFTGVILVRLPPKQFYSEKFVLRFPLEETAPPFRLEREIKVIRFEQVGYIQGSVGFLPMAQDLVRLLQHKPLGPYINGHEVVEFGSKRENLLNSQKIIFSKKISFTSLDKVGLR